MERVIEAVNKLAANHTAMNTIMVVMFGGISYRSYLQQHEISALEAEKDSIANSNKAIKKTIWDWKQQLFSEAELNAQNAILPLSKLRPIYGEITPLVTGGEMQKGVEKSQLPKLII